MIILGVPLSLCETDKNNFYLPKSSDLHTPNGVSLSVKLATKSIFESVAATMVGGEAALILNSVKFVICKSIL